MTYEEIFSEVQNWSLDEQLRLAEGLVAMIRQQVSPPRRSILEFKGIGRGLWDEYGGVDEFIRQKRASWEERAQYIERIQEESQKAKEARQHSIMERRQQNADESDS